MTKALEMPLSVKALETSPPKKHWKWCHLNPPETESKTITYGKN
jgi:hypothetical protein